MLELDIYNVIGFIGTFTYLTAYGLLSHNTISGDSILYLVLNLVAASLVCFSLIKYWNAPAFVIQASWIVISVYGLVRRMRGQKKPVKTL